MSFVPDRSNITGITNASPAVVTTSTPHGLLTGMVARIVVPNNYGMYQINGQSTHVSVLSPTTFGCYNRLIDPISPLNSTGYATFVVPAQPGLLAQVLPMGEGSQPINDVPWQQNNGYCDSLLDDAVYNNSTSEIPF
jgi:hypothetical protein